MPRQTKTNHDPKGATDFLTGASDVRPSGVKPPKVPKGDKSQVGPSNRSSAQVEHKSGDAGGQIASIRAQLLEEVGPLAMKQIIDVMQDKDAKFTPEHKQKLAFQVLSELGLGDKEHIAKPNARADMVTLQAVNARLERILAKCDAPDVAPDVQAMFG